MRMIVAEGAMVRGEDGERAVADPSECCELVTAPDGCTYRYKASRSVSSGGGGGEQIILLFSKQVGEWNCLCRGSVMNRGRLNKPNPPMSD